MERIVNGCERLYVTKKFNNLKEMIENTKSEFGENVAFKLKQKNSKELRLMKYNEYIDEINCLGTSLISIGLKDKKIGVISENRYEWEEAYLSIVCGTGIVVPLDKALTEREIINLIERSDMEAIFYSEKYSSIMDKVRENKVGKVKFYISMDLEEKESDVYSQKELVRMGKELIKNGARSFLDAKIDNECMSIMLFTSGTTSQSKIVKLSHKNICTNVYDISSVFDVTEDDTLMSFLPLHHVFECSVGFLYPVSVGASLGFCTGIRHIAEDLKLYETSVMISVPVLFESIYKQIMKSIDAKGKTSSVKFGMNLAKLLKKIGIDARKSIFKEIHDNFGGKLRLFVAGAAAFDKEVEKNFNLLGIDTYQGYGLTECSPVVAAEHKGCTKLGSIGKTFPSLQTKIVNPNEMGIGELAVKGDSIMLGYDGLDKTGFDEDGWFLTGDLAYIDKDEYIFITGRQKSVIVLKNGKNVYPEEIESLINKIPGVKESFVYGKPEKDDEIDLKVCAEIVYDKDKLNENFGSENLDEIKEKIWTEVKNINKLMPNYKHVQEITITNEEIIKTTTLKIKRFEEIKKVLNK